MVPMQTRKLALAVTSTIISSLAVFCAPPMPRPTPSPYPQDLVSPIKCPEGTTRFVQRLPLEVRQKQFFAQRDEFCLDKDFKRHGPFARWGPNGERFSAGQYNHGAKDGTWTNWERGERETWSNGTRLAKTAEIPLPPGTGVLDFSVCAFQFGSVDNGVDEWSFHYTLQPKDRNTCVLFYHIAESPGFLEPPRAHACDVPRSLGKVAYDWTTVDLVPPEKRASWKCRGIVSLAVQDGPERQRR
jgi:hypothetical protein